MSGLAVRALWLLAAAVLVVNLAQFGVKANVPEKFALAAAVIALLPRSRIESPALVLLGAMLLATLLSAILTDDPLFSWDLYARGLLSLAVPALLLALLPGEADRQFLLALIAALPLGYAAMGLGYAAAGMAPLTTVDFLGTSRFGGSTDAAWLGAAAVAGAVAAIFRAEASGRALWLALVPVDLALTLLSGGRMAAAAFAVLVPLCFFAGLRARGSDKMLATAAGAVAVAAASPWLFDTLARRAASGSASGRDEIWDYLLEVAAAHPWFGIGLGRQYTVMPEELQTTVHTVGAHDEYLRLLVELGWAGAVPVLAAFAGLFAWRVVAPSTARRWPVAAAGVMTAVYCLTDNVLSVPAIFLIPVAIVLGCQRPLAGPVETEPEPAPRLCASS